MKLCNACQRVMFASFYSEFTFHFILFQVNFNAVGYNYETLLEISVDIMFEPFPSQLANTRKVLKQFLKSTLHLLLIYVWPESIIQYDSM